MTNMLLLTSNTRLSVYFALDSIFTNIDTFCMDLVAMLELVF
jgi:hypothetical protein